MRRLVPLAVLASCSQPQPDTPAKIETLDYVVPDGWKSRDLSSLRGATFEWTPDGDNQRKESLVVSRVHQPALATEEPRLARALKDLNQRLPRGRFSPPRSFVTRGGLAGVRVDGSFTPPNTDVPYHRSHAVLVDGSSLVHVLYTARAPEREHIEAVLDGFRTGE